MGHHESMKIEYPTSCLTIQACGVPLLKPTPSFNYKLKLYTDNLTLLVIIILLGLHVNKKFHCEATFNKMLASI